jgi:peptidoglycan/xylan/chitin deacetylase (PgdA/CDA1 family)
MDKTTGGDIILLHDRLPQGTGAMLQVLPGIIDDLREKGLEFVLAGPRGDSENHLCESAR